MIKRIYCFGNPLIAYDNLALKLAKEIKIKGVEFVICRSPEELWGQNAQKLVIMDVAKGINQVRVFADISKIQSGKLLSLHDFDLGYFLKLMAKMGELPEVKIIALPMGGEFDQIKKEVVFLLKSW
jgi:Ni,Fe-hydrogenase maturation factor